MQYEMTVTRSSNRCRSAAGSWKQLPICQVCWFGFSWERSFVSCGGRKGARLHTRVPYIWNERAVCLQTADSALLVPCSSSLHASSSGVRQCYLHPFWWEWQERRNIGQSLGKIWPEFEFLLKSLESSRLFLSRRHHPFKWAWDVNGWMSPASLAFHTDPSMVGTSSNRSLLGSQLHNETSGKSSSLTSSCMDRMTMLKSLFLLPQLNTSVGTITSPLAFQQNGQKSKWSSLPTMWGTENVNCVVEEELF